jgi:O-antigen biosynthesis protein
VAKICFLVGSLNISGGTYVILQHASRLSEAGHEVTLAVQEPFDDRTLFWHDRARALRCIPFGEGSSELFDLVISTWWRTALDILTYKAARYAYFVQSVESRFYPSEELPLRALVDSTYTLPVSYVTEATWIQSHLGRLYGRSAALVRNGVRKDIYTQDGPVHTPRPLAPAQPRVLVEGHLSVPFKNVALSIKAARAAGARDIWMLTGSPVSRVPCVKRVFSCVPAAQTPLIYRSCDILVKLSTVEGMFGPPLEHFHCGGTCIVYDVTGHDEYIVNNRNGLVIGNGNAQGVVSALRNLLADRDLLAYLQAGARETARTWPDWTAASDAFGLWTQAALDGAETDTDAIREITAKAWGDYERDEKRRLAENPSIERTRRREALMKELPAWVQTYRRALNFKLEVLTQDWTTR